MADLVLKLMVEARLNFELVAKKTKESTSSELIGQWHAESTSGSEALICNDYITLCETRRPVAAVTLIWYVKPPQEIEELTLHVTGSFRENNWLQNFSTLDIWCHLTCDVCGVEGNEKTNLVFHNDSEFAAGFLGEFILSNVMYRLGDIRPFPAKPLQKKWTL